MRKFDIFDDYENSHLEIADLENDSEDTYAYDELGDHDVDGIPIAVKRDSAGRLKVKFIPDTHLLAIGATRSGKTTGFVIPTINIMLEKKNKPSMIVSDPKGELYRTCAKKYEKQGIRTIFLDFTDYRHSDCWNPMTQIYRLYQQYLNVENEVTVVKTVKGNRHSFRGVVYDDMNKLRMAISEIKEGLFDTVEMKISALALSIIPTLNTRDPYWENAARDLLVAIMFGMLEDSDPSVEQGRITEDTFSFNTVLRIFDTFTDSRSPYDGGYFSHRDKENSKAYRIADKCIVEQAEKTRNCIVGSFSTKINIFRDTAIRNITSSNSFEVEDLDGEKPVVIFLSYRDEEPIHYEIISMFLSNLYSELIGISRKKGKPLSRPWYFLLDEFGNLPKFNSFEKTISACGGRNIWFLLILQSYAQLYQVYGKEVADTIKDNLNAHIFFGTNNPLTKNEFSEECGKKTVLSPMSALNGNGEYIDQFIKETIPLVPVSKLNVIAPGECYVTRMRAEPCLSYMERSYRCPEFDGEIAQPNDRTPPIVFSDPKYVYNVPRYESSSRRPFSSFFD